MPLLERDDAGVLDATTILEELGRRHGERFGERHLRTLQRRLHDWCVLHGPDREVFLEQEHVPGREGAIDFTDCSTHRVTIAGQFFAHLLFQFILSFSKWRFVALAFSETFEALVSGVQGALWELGGVPAVLRSDNLSAATHALPGGGRELNRRLKAVLDHYDLRSTRIEPGKSNQNGIAEKAHDRLKSMLEQALVLRGSRDFVTVESYLEFVEEVRTRLNAATTACRVPDYTKHTDVVVRKWSTIHFGRKTYSVPSRLIGAVVEVHQCADTIEVHYRKKLTATMPRIRGEQPHRIDYRDVIWSLVRKPGAFARYRYREELFPSLTFRRAYDALVDARGERADVEYVRILHLAASTLESRVEAALDQLLSAGVRFDYVAVKALAASEQRPLPEVSIPAPDPAGYNCLLACGGDA